MVGSYGVFTVAGTPEEAVTFKGTVVAELEGVVLVKEAEN